MSKPETLKKIQDYYKKHGGDTKFKKLLDEFKSNYRTEIEFFEKSLSKNYSDQLLPFKKNADFVKHMATVTGCKNSGIFSSSGYQLTDIDGRIDYLSDKIYKALKEDIYKDKKSSTCTEKKLLCMYIGKLLEICTTIRENIAHEVSKQRMAGKSLEELHANFKIVEPLIRNDFKKVLKPYMDKDGYPFSIKSSDSIRAKIEMAQQKFFKGKGYSDLEACKRCVIDAIRYTVMYGIDIYASKFNDAVKKLENEGYKLIRCKNFWNDPGAYNGLNCLFLTPYGYFAEVQFHTPESKELNFKTHKLYEELRDVKTSPERKSQIEEEMKKLAKTTPDEEELINTIKKIEDFELPEIVWSLPPQ